MKSTYLKVLSILCVMLSTTYATAESERRLTPNYLFSDFENMFEELDTAANQGDARAQMTLGLFYLTGVTSADGSVPITKDIDAGKTWIIRAIDSGNVCAMGVLAMEYAEGKNLPRDDAEANRWLRQAIAKEGPEAKIAMLVRYETGLAIPVDDHEVSRLTLESATYGYPLSQAKAADLLLEGRYAGRDLVKAYQWMALAVKAEPDNAVWVAKRDDIAALLSHRQLIAANAKIDKWKPKGHSECENPEIIFEFYRLD